MCSYFVYVLVFRVWHAVEARVFEWTLRLTHYTNIYTVWVLHVLHWISLSLSLPLALSLSPSPSLSLSLSVSLSHWFHTLIPDRQLLLSLLPLLFMLLCWLADWSAGQLVCAGCLTVVWLAGWLAGWLAPSVAWLLAWLLDRLLGCRVAGLLGCSVARLLARSLAYLLAGCGPASLCVCVCE